jgi:hypothetical protein
VKNIRISWVVALGLLVAGCSHAPNTEIDAAKQALVDARQAQASDYAPQAWTAAQDAESKLEVELDAQAQRWTPLRSYTVAKQLALETKAAAERSRDEAIAGKDKAKTEVTTMIAEAREAVSQAKAAVASAPRGKGTEADLAALKSDATSIDDTLQEMQRAFDAGDYVAAKVKAQAAIDAAKKIQSDVEQAKTARRAA